MSTVTIFFIVVSILKKLMSQVDFLKVTCDIGDPPIIKSPTIAAAVGCRVGPLMGGPECSMSILRNRNVACRGRLLSSMSHVEFKK